MASWNQRSRGMEDDTIDRENQHRAGVLASKMGRLKNVALDIEMEARDQNRLLDHMDGDFDSTTGLLDGSVKRIGNMITSGKNNKKLLCYMVLFAVAIFFLIYFITMFAKKS